MKDYLFEYEEVSVYASAVDLLRPHLRPGGTHLDIGCGEGAIASRIRESHVAYVGFDLNDKATSRLKDKGFEAYSIDLSDTGVAMEVIRNATGGRSVGSISMLDVVEHLPYDNRFLHELSAWLLADHPDAVLVTSIPNFAHVDVCARLMGGRWDYTESGLLDRTHNNVLTEASIHHWFNHCGWVSRAMNHYELTVSDQRAVKPRLYAANSEAGIGRHIREIKKVVDPRAQVYQFVNLWVPTGTPPVRPDAPDVIHVVLGQVEEVSASRVTSAPGLETIIVRESTDVENLWRGANGEYVIFTCGGCHADDHSVMGLVRSVLQTDERPVLLIDSTSRATDAGILDLDMSPGPWLAVPASFAKQHLSARDLQSLTREQWQTFVVTALVFCGVKVGESEMNEEGGNARVFSSITLREMFRQGELEDLVSKVWPHVNDLRDFLCLPERLRIESLESELHQAGLHNAVLMKNFQNYRDEIEASVGWRMTRPLRWLASVLNSRSSRG